MTRFKPDGDRRENAVYQLWDDDRPAGWAKDFKRDVYTTWSSKNGVELTEAERLAWQERLAVIRAERKQAEEEYRAEARTRAATKWEAARPETGEHPYLRAKGVGAYGLRTNGSLLYVPLRDTEDTLHGLQYISSPDREKRFLAGTAVRGHYHAHRRGEGSHSDRGGVRDSGDVARVHRRGGDSRFRLREPPARS